MDRTEWNRRWSGFLAQALKDGETPLGERLAKEYSVPADDKAVKGSVDAPMESLEALWRTLWTDEIALLVREKGGNTASAVGLQEFLSGSSKASEVGFDYEPHIEAVQRQARRLYRTLELEPMVEERTFGDYRLTLEQCVDALRSEAASAAESAEIVLSTIGALKQAIPNKSSSQASTTLLEKLEAAVTTAQLQCKELETSVGVAQFKGNLADAFRARWHSVDERFGTWQRRVRPALIQFVAFGILAIVLYMIVGLWLPTPLLLVLLGAIPIVAAVSRYYLTRANLKNEIALDKAEIAMLDPDNEPEAQKWFWATEKDTNSVVGVGNELESGLTKIRERGATTHAYQGWATPVSWVVIVLTLAIPWVIATRRAPEHELVNLTTAQGACSVTRGRIVWAGPGQVLVMPVTPTSRGALASLVAVHSSAVTRIERQAADGSSAPLPACTAAGPATRPPVVVDLSVAPTPTTTTLQRSYILPVFTDPVPCEPAATGKAVDAPDGRNAHASTEYLFENLARGIEACGLRRPVVLDIRGFASTKPFVCPGMTQSELEMLNLDLAETRRKSIITELRSRIDSTKYARNLVIVFEGGPRWGTGESALKAMRKGNAFEDRDGTLTQENRERLSRYTEIEVLSSGDCARRDATVIASKG